MDRYKIFINLDVLNEVPRSGKVRGELMALIRSLEFDPTQCGDYSELDEVGRPVYTKIIGRYACQRS